MSTVTNEEYGPWWEDWPEELRESARQVCDHLTEGSPGDALAVLDRMAIDLEERRGTIAELANAED